MKTLYYAYFHIPKEGKIQDRVMLSHVALTALLIVVYLLSISASAYAFFASSVHTYNTVTAANFEAQVCILDGEEQPLTPERTEDGWLTAELEPGRYQVSLKPGGTAETGFCLVELDGLVYHSAQLGVSQAAENGYTQTLSFELEIYEPSEIGFLSYWGTSSHYPEFSLDGSLDSYIVGGEVLTAGAEDAENAGDDPEDAGDDPEETDQFFFDDPEETEAAEAAADPFFFEEPEEAKDAEETGDPLFFE